MPSGVYDENTRLSVTDFQRKNGIGVTGIVDYETFNLLYREFVFINEKTSLNKRLGSFTDFPILPGYMGDAMIHLNRSMRRLLDYYGFSHRLRESNFYSEETARAVGILRSVYIMEEKELIDEELYVRIIKDHDSIGRFNNNFA